MLRTLGGILLTPLVFGGLIVDKPTDNITAYGITASRTADNFLLSQADTLGSVRFWWGPTVGGALSDFSGTITYAFYQDSAGSIGTLVGSGTVTGLVSTATGAFRSSCGGAPNCPQQTVDFNLVTPLSLAAGTYWLELHEGNSLVGNDGTSTFWATSSQSGSAKQCLFCSQLPTNNAGVSLAFQISSVPEPGTTALVAVGLVGLWRLSRRRLLSR